MYIYIYNIFWKYTIYILAFWFKNIVDYYSLPSLLFNPTLLLPPTWGLWWLWGGDCIYNSPLLPHPSYPNNSLLGYLIYVTHHIWTRKGREIWVYGCACVHTLCFWSCALISANITLSLYLHHILSWGGRKRHSLYQTLPPSSFTYQ